MTGRTRMVFFPYYDSIRGNVEINLEVTQLTTRDVLTIVLLRHYFLLMPFDGAGCQLIYIIFLTFTSHLHVFKFT